MSYNNFSHKKDLSTSFCTADLMLCESKCPFLIIAFAFSLISLILLSKMVISFSISVCFWSSFLTPRRSDPEIFI